MKGARSSPILFVVILLATVSSQGLRFPDMQDICQNQGYLTPSRLPVTCCSSEKLTPGLSFEKYWKDCATPDDNEQYLNVTLWRVYECIVQKHLDSENKTLTLENFAHIMTKPYPVDKRLAIFDKICKHSDLAYENQKGLEVLKNIRKKYYDIEVEVCSKSALAMQQQQQQQQEQELLNKQEEEKYYPPYQRLQRRGKECLNTEVPIDPWYIPRAEEKAVIATWTMFLETVSNQTDNLTISDEIYRVCDLYFNWIAGEVATADEIWMKRRLDLQLLFDRIKPTWANKNVTHIFKTNVDKSLRWGVDLDDGTDISESQKLEQDFIAKTEDFFKTRFKKVFTNSYDVKKAKKMLDSCLVPALIRVSMDETSYYVLCRSGKP